MPKFSNNSEKKLDSCHPDLAIIFYQVIETYDCIVLEGHRSKERQLELYNSKKSKVKVSKHNENPSLAVDVAPYPVVWDGSEKIRARFYHFAGFVLATGSSMGIRIRWGGDWDGDFHFDDQSFDDLVHFELLNS